MDFAGVAFVGEGALRHTEDDLCASVIEDYEVVVGGVDGESFDFTCASEVAHFAEEFYTSCHGSACDFAGTSYDFTVFDFYAIGVFFDGFCSVDKSGVGHCCDVGDVDVVGDVVGGFAVVGGEEDFTVGDKDALAPVGCGSALHFGVILSGFEAVAVNVAAVNPVAHPYHVFLAVDCKSGAFYLSGFGAPGDGAFPLEGVGVVNVDGDVVTAAVFEFLVAGVDFAVVNVDIAEVVSEFGVLEGLVVFHYDVALFVVLVEYACVGDVVVVFVDGDALTSCYGDDFFESVLGAEVLRANGHAEAAKGQ